MTAPGTIMMAKLFEPETEVPETYGNVKLDMPEAGREPGRRRGARHQRGAAADAQRHRDAGVVRGAGGAAQRRLRRGARLARPGSRQNLQTVLGWVCRPIAWAMGVPWQDSGTVGGLLGTRMVLNEFIAYAQLGPLEGARSTRARSPSRRSPWPGFANFSSVGIQIGGIGALVPERKARPRPARLPRDARRHAGQLPVRHDRRDAAVTAARRRRRARRDRRGRRGHPRAGSAAGRRRSPSCWARAWAVSPSGSTDAVRIPTATSPAFPSPTVEGHRGELVAGTLGGHARCWRRAAASTCTRGTPRRPCALPVRVFAGAGRRHPAPHQRGRRHPADLRARHADADRRSHESDRSGIR